VAKSSRETAASTSLRALPGVTGAGVTLPPVTTTYVDFAEDQLDALGLTATGLGKAVRDQLALLDTYVGIDAEKRILSGHTRRGDVESLSEHDRRILGQWIRDTSPATELPPRARRRRRRVLLVAASASVVLLPWLGYLAATLPDRHRASEWWLAWVGFDDRKLGYQNRRLSIMNIDGSNKRVLTGSLDRSVSSPVWAGDSRSVYVQVEDPQAALDKAESLGGKTVLPVMTIPNTVTLALFADPEGHVVGLVARETQSS